MKRHVPIRRSKLSRKAPLRNFSEFLKSDAESYKVSRLRFLSEHPYCQLWLSEHGVSEEVAIQSQGHIRLREPDGPLVPVPLATEIHHTNKRRADRLLDSRYWMAVSAEAHQKIEANKDWARVMGYLLGF